MLRKSAILLALMGLVLSAGCDDSEAPTVEQLYGVWLNKDALTQRVYEFRAVNTELPDLAGVTPVFRLYEYQVGAQPLEQYRGTYSMQGDTLVTTVLFSDGQPELVGDALRWTLSGFNPNGFSLKQEDGVFSGREYIAQDTLP